MANNINMKAWMEAYRDGENRRPMPILAFPCVGPLGYKVRDLVASSEKQAEGMAWIAAHTDEAAAVGFMDLSVEAEAFGANVRFSDTEVPTVIGNLVNDEDEANALAVPKVGDGRTGIYVEAIGQAKAKIKDRPVFAGMIGPYSLAARLLGVSEAMMFCFDEPDTVHTVLNKATEFLISYAKAFRDAGADGILVAEPVAGLLSPAMEEEFSSPYMAKIVAATQTEDYPVFYHNCGGGVPRMTDSISSIGAAGYHFGNAVDIVDLLEKMPDALIFGNVDPAGQFCMGTPDSITAATKELLARAGGYPNFRLSSGCDIPPKTPWENVEAFFAAAKEFYAN